MTIADQVKISRVILILALGLVLGAAAPAFGADVKDAGGEGNPSIYALSKEYEAVVRAVEYYIEGGRRGSAEIMKNAFHPGANIFGYVDGHPAGGPIQLLYDMVEGRAAGDIPYEIIQLDVTGNIAMLKLDIPNWGGKHYTDMFTLLKMEDGEWKIVSKVSHLN